MSCPSKTGVAQSPESQRQDIQIVMQAPRIATQKISKTAEA
jgi:hypothetical protein